MINDIVLSTSFLDEMTEQEAWNAAGFEPNNRWSVFNKPGIWRFVVECGTMDYHYLGDGDQFTVTLPHDQDIRLEVENGVLQADWRDCDCAPACYVRVI